MYPWCGVLVGRLGFVVNVFFLNELQSTFPNHLKSVQQTYISITWAIIGWLTHHSGLSLHASLVSNPCSSHPRLFTIHPNHTRHPYTDSRDRMMSLSTPYKSMKNRCCIRYSRTDILCLSIQNFMVLSQVAYIFICCVTTDSIQRPRCHGLAQLISSIE